jgi:hypothetical protein
MCKMTLEGMPKNECLLYLFSEPSIRLVNNIVLLVGTIVDTVTYLAINKTRGFHQRNLKQQYMRSSRAKNDQIV